MGFGRGTKFGGPFDVEFSVLKPPNLSRQSITGK